MDTRWKNIVEKIFAFFQKKWISVPGLILMVFGVFGLGILISYRRSYTTETVLGFGFLLNICIGIGLSLVLKQYLERRYQEWNKGKEWGYEEWKMKEAYSLKELCKVFGVCGLAAVWYLYDLVEGGGRWGGLSKGWYFNFSTAYVLVITVLVQFLVAWKAVRKFWYGKLDVVFDQIEVRLQMRLAEALEIERKSLEKVTRSDQLRVDLITNVSHDLKTPLTSMVGYVELIKKEELSDVVRDYIDVISARTEKLKEMINSLFSLAKASSGNVELKKENFEVNRLIEQIFADMDDRIKESGLKFVRQLTGEDTKIYSDNTYFYRICQNLIENALKYSAKGTRVFVRTYLKGCPAGTDMGEAADEMEDSGLHEAGAPALKADEMQDSERFLAVSGRGKKSICIEITNTAGYFMDFTKEDIVERFVRGDHARTSEGNGLGLAIVSAYAKALGGEFEIKIDCDQFKACLEFGA